MGSISPGDDARKTPQRLERLSRDLAGLPTGTGERYFHDDLPHLEAPELRLERERLRASLVLASRPHPWIAERLEYVERELARRATDAAR